MARNHGSRAGKHKLRVFPLVRVDNGFYGQRKIGNALDLIDNHRSVQPPNSFAQMPTGVRASTSVRQSHIVVIG